MRIVCVEPLGISREHFEELKQEMAADGHVFDYYLDRKEDAATLAARMAEADIAVISNIPLPTAVLCQCPKLKYLSVAFTGLDHIDLAYCREHHIEVQNAAGYSTTAVSELAVGLMLDVLRRVTSLDAAIRQGEGRGAFLGRELRGKTVGVVGTGAIGTATIRLLLAFGCKVMAYNRSRHADVEQMGVGYTDLDTLMQRSDIVTLHHRPRNLHVPGRTLRQPKERRAQTAVGLQAGRPPGQQRRPGLAGQKRPRLVAPPLRPRRPRPRPASPVV